LGRGNIDESLLEDVLRMIDFIQHKINETYSSLENNFGEAFGIPEKLIDVVIANDLIMIFLFPHELAV